jgi:hypothetical protein
MPETKLADQSANERPQKPGFADFRDGFQICPHELNRDHWTEGFVKSAVRGLVLHSFSV